MTDTIAPPADIGELLDLVRQLSPENRRRFRAYANELAKSAPAAMQKLWRPERVQRFVTMRAHAAARGLTVKVNARDRDMFYLSIWRDDFFLAGFFDLADAEALVMQEPWHG